MNHHDVGSAVSASLFGMEVKRDATSNETMISSGWMVVFLSFVKKCSADVTVVGFVKVVSPLEIGGCVDWLRRNILVGEHRP